jgi:DNA-binding NarL/FixJ family response regulator
MEEKQFEALEERLDKITRLLAHSAVKDLQSEQEKVDLLDRLGLRTSEIARYLGKSSQNVSTVLGNLRKKSGERPKSETSNETEVKAKPGQGTPEASDGDENKAQQRRDQGRTEG